MKNDTDRNALLEQAVEIARGIVAGDIQPNDGCAKIGDINHALDWPEELAALGLLAHEQYDHELIGITKNVCLKLLKNAGCSYLGGHER